LANVDGESASSAALLGPLMETLTRRFLPLLAVPASTPTTPPMQRLPTELLHMARLAATRSLTISLACTPLLCRGGTAAAAS
jgi:hypothetical protein